MKIFLPFAILLVSSIATAQPFTKAANDAFLITRMAAKFHIRPRPLDDEFSANVFDVVIKKTDPERLLLTGEDMKQLEAFRYQLDNEINGHKTAFVQMLASIYQQRLQQADTMAATILRKPFNYSLDEKYTTREDTGFAANPAAMRVKLYKNVKYAVVSALSHLLENVKEPARQKKITDSAEVIFRKKAADAFHRNTEREMQWPGGIAQMVCNDYCKAIAGCYDPHTAYMTQTDRENFESGIGKKNMVFGFNLDEDDEGEVTIDNLQPGSSAFKSGMINKGDKIISMQWENAKPVDVSEASAAEIGAMLAADNHARITLTFLKADGTKRQVTLSKEQSTQDDEEDKVKSYLLKGTRTIGYISLPSFYEDWEDKRSLNGCSNDVAKEILKLKKENINGLILDVRYNGGGSVSEAVDLAGIFIDAGPITQMKTNEPKPYTLKDANRGTIYDGPMMLLVNGFSASASELLAGVLQDYHRAVIVGSPTYGKATGQTILPLDTTISMHENNNEKTSSAYLKLTLSQVYRVSGATAQFKGVQPDILLPDATDASESKEKNEPFAIAAGNIEPNKYYLPNKPLPLSMLQEKASAYEKEDPYFAEIKKYIAYKAGRRQSRDVSLKLSDLVKANAADEDKEDVEANDSAAVNKFYKVGMNSYEQERLKANKDLQKSFEAFENALAADAVVKMAYRLMLLMPE